MFLQTLRLLLMHLLWRQLPRQRQLLLVWNLPFLLFLFRTVLMLQLLPLLWRQRLAELWATLLLSTLTQRLVNLCM
ncbi:hypothetical protein CH252_05025 [Rhodococcus sp. 06-1477-1B]|nr:hypothetical protein CH252_05025 [Rhodococcus sp. 06-1477-1B]